MKIMYVNTLGVWGGVATYLKPLIYDQLERGNQVSLVVGSEGELTDYVKAHFPSVKLIILSSMKRDVDVKSIFKSVFIFRKIVKNEKPDIIHLNCIMAGIIGRVGSLFMGIKIIYNAHGWAFGPRVSKKYKLPAIVIEKLLALVTDKIICVSDYEKKFAEKYHIFKNNSQCVVIKNGSKDLGIRHPVELDDNVFRVSMAARFAEPKDQLSLIKGFKLFKEKYQKRECLLYLLGDGPTLNECMDYVLRSNLKNNVIFTGMVKDVVPYYSFSDVVSLITDYDAISISLIEALSMAKPILGTNVSGVPENFSTKNINGFCIENNTPEVIAEYLLRMSNNRDLLKKMGKNSRKLYLSHFTIEKSVNEHDNLYELLLRK